MSEGKKRVCDESERSHLVLVTGQQSRALFSFIAVYLVYIYRDHYECGGRPALFCGQFVHMPIFPGNTLDYSRTSTTM